MVETGHHSRERYSPFNVRPRRERVTWSAVKTVFQFERNSRHNSCRVTSTFVLSFVADGFSFIFIYFQGDGSAEITVSRM